MVPEREDHTTASDDRGHHSHLKAVLKPESDNLEAKREELESAEFRNQGTNAPNFNKEMI